jgi:hypothetical protein
MVPISFGELLLIALVALVLVGPRRLQSLKTALSSHSRTLTPASPTATLSRSPRQRSGWRLLWRYRNAIGWGLLGLGLGLIVADLVWLHTGPPLLALGAVCLFLFLWFVW